MLKPGSKGTAENPEAKVRCPSSPPAKAMHTAFRISSWSCLAQEEAACLSCLATHVANMAVGFCSTMHRIQFRGHIACDCCRGDADPDQVHQSLRCGSCPPSVWKKTRVGAPSSLGAQVPPGTVPIADVSEWNSRP
eukprot:2035241-Amphidinium_carterae.1